MRLGSLRLRIRRGESKDEGGMLILCRGFDRVFFVPEREDEKRGKKSIYLGVGD